MNKIYIYKLTDALGEVSWDVCKEPSDWICVYGYDKNKTLHQFDSTEAHYLHCWAEELGFKVEIVEKDIDI